MQRHVTLPHVVDGEVFVEETNEGTDRARGVVVFRLAQEQRAAPFEIAKVEVVAERGAGDLAGTVDREDDLRLGIVPLRLRVNADVRTRSDGGHGLALREA